MKSVILNFFDGAFTAFLTFFLAFWLLNYYTPRPYSIIFATCFAVLIFLIAFEKLKKSSLTKTLKTKQSKAVENTCYSLCLLEQSRVLALFEKALNRLNYATIKRKGCILISQIGVVVFPMFSFNNITKTDVVRVFNSISSGQKAYIFAQTPDKEVLDFITRFNDKVELIEPLKAHLLLEKTDCLPKEVAHNDKPKLIKTFFSNLFKKKNYKRFLLFGVLFLFYSAFVSVKIYYLFFSYTFFMLSLSCRLFGKE